jgi:hypothetical protein
VRKRLVTTKEHVEKKLVIPGELDQKNGSVIQSPRNNEGGFMYEDTGSEEALWESEIPDRW